MVCLGTKEPPFIGRPNTKIEALVPVTPSALPTEKTDEKKKAKIKPFEDEPTEPTLPRRAIVRQWME